MSWSSSPYGAEPNVSSMSFHTSPPSVECGINSCCAVVCHPELALPSMTRSMDRHDSPPNFFYDAVLRCNARTRVTADDPRPKEIVSICGDMPREKR